MMKTSSRSLVLGVPLTLLLACRGDAPPGASKSAPASAGAHGVQEREEAHDHGAHDHGAHDPDAKGPEAPAAARAEADGHDHGHAHGAAEGSDLDRAVDELFAATCEHAKKTHECDECRYEVGVVRVPAKLLEGGLLKRSSASSRRVEAPVTLTGEVKLDERRVTHVAPRVEGTIRRVHASLGERVRRGQLIVELESVGLGEAESEYLEAHASLRLAASTAARQEELRKEQISSEREYLEARQSLEAAQIRSRAAAEKLTRLGVDRSDVEELGRSAQRARAGGLAVRAPADGIILEMHAVPGELVKPEESIVTVGDVSSVWVWADVHEDQLGRLLEAQGGGKLRAEVRVKAFPDTVFAGTVDFVGPTMDERTRTVKVRIGVPNLAFRLRAGMFASVRVFLPGQEQALAVPAAAVLSDEGRSFVFVHHRADYWVRRPVEVGRRWHDWVEVKAGLAGGETLAAEGSFLLKSDVLRSKMGAGCAD